MLQVISKIFARLHSRRRLQYAAGITATLTFLIVGCFGTWPSPNLPKLEAPDSPIPITRDEGSWIVSLVGVGAMMATMPAGYLVNKVGRKPLLVFLALPFLASWFLIIFARSVVELLVSRLITGFCVGVAFSVCPIYLGEIAEDSVRGLLGTLMQLMQNLGSLFGYALAPYVSYTMNGAVSTVFPLLLLVFMIFMPESPYFLIMKGRTDDAEIALMRLRGYNSRQSVQEELQRIRSVTEEQMKQRGRPRDLVATRGTRRALLVMIGLLFFQQFGGVTAILSNTQQIFDITPGSTLTSSESAIVVGVIQIIASLVTSSAVERLGRRPLLLTSALGCCVSLAVMGAYQFVNLRTSVDTTAFDWLPLTCLIVFLVTYCLGLGPLPIAMMGEIFPSNVKGLAISIGVMFVSACFVVVTKLYQVAIDGIGPYTTFWIFSIVSAFGFVFIYFIVPETKGKPLEYIIAELNGKSQVQKNVPAALDVFTIST
ncbi:facilitated trehalose transporter Tret1-like [Periplaneta americana]|uniref:facilitated trehalose transporter Tret1-like n=1 Tax=Periplaneta americana TaxID=6978 RepID=UPI0037E788CD